MTQALVVRRFFVLITMLFVSQAEAESATVEGRWLTSQSVIDVRDCGGQLCGVIERLLLSEHIDQSQLLDFKNKDRTLRARPVLGMNLLMDFGALVSGKRTILKAASTTPIMGEIIRPASHSSVLTS